MKLLVTFLRGFAAIAVALAAIGLLIAASTPVGASVALVLLGLGGLALVRPLPFLWIDNRTTALGFIAAAFTGLLFCFVLEREQPASSRQAGLKKQESGKKEAAVQDEAPLIALRRRDPQLYLQILKQGQDPGWESEFQKLDKKGYDAFVSERRALEEKQRRESIETLKAELKMIPPDDRDGLRRIYGRLAQLDPATAEYKTKLQTLSAPKPTATRQTTLEEQKRRHSIEPLKAELKTIRPNDLEGLRRIYGQLAELDSDTAEYRTKLQALDAQIRRRAEQSELARQEAQNRAASEAKKKESAQEDETALFALRSRDPQLYLEILEQAQDPRWESEFQTLDKKGYETFALQRQAQEEKPRTESIETLQAELKTIPLDDLDGLRRIYGRLAQLDPATTEYKTKLQALNAPKQPAATRQTALEKPETEIKRAARQDEAPLLALRSKDPQRYLETQQTQDPRWESEFQTLDKRGYEAFVLQSRALEEKQRRESIETLQAELKTIRLNDLDGLRRIYDQLTQLDSTTAEYRTKLQALTAHIQKVAEQKPPVRGP